MVKAIAVFLGNDERTSSFDQSGVIKLYSNESPKWSVINEIPFDISNDTNIKTIREKINLLTKSIDPCKIIVGRTVTGLPYNILDKSGFNIWEIDGKAEEFLDYVLEQEETEQHTGSKETENTLSDIKPYPISTNDDGSYFLDLITLQEQNKNISSKKALIPFLEGTQFYRLEVLCTHIPPWLEFQSKEHPWKLEILKLATNKLRVIILNKTCNE
jgi:Fe-only nitrogenase accessory protein AnfO